MRVLFFILIIICFQAFHEPLNVFVNADEAEKDPVKEKVIEGFLNMFNVQVQGNIVNAVPAAQAENKGALEADLLQMSIESIFLALSERELEEAIHLIEIVIEEHSNALIDGDPVSWYVLNLISNESSEFKDKWTERWIVEVEKFVSQGTVPSDFLLKICFHPKKDQYFARLILLLNEAGDLYRLAESLLLANTLNMDTQECYRVYLEVLNNLPQSPLLTWALEGWPLSLLAKKDKAEFFQLRNAKKWLVNEWPQVNQGQRPSNGIKWKASVSVEKKIEMQNEIFETVSPYFKHSNRQVSFSNDQIKYVNWATDGSTQLWTINSASGKTIWRHLFKVPETKVFQCLYSTKDTENSFDAICWATSNKNRGANLFGQMNNQTYDVEFVVHAASGQKLWQASLNDFVGESTSWCLAGQPVQAQGAVFIPFMDIADISFQGGKGFLHILALNEMTGDALWVREVDEINYKSLATLVDPVNLYFHKNALLMPTGQMSLNAIDPHNGRKLWSRNLKQWYQKAGINFETTQDLGMNIGFGAMFNGVKIPKEKSEWNERNGFFRVLDDIACLKEHGSNVIFFIDLNTGELINPVTFSSDQSPKFLNWIDSGALFIDKNNLIYVDGLDEKNLNTKVVQVDLPRPIKNLFSWGEGILLNTGYELYEVVWREKTQKSSVRKLLDFPDDKSLSVHRNQLIQYNDASIEALKLYPSSITAIQELWSKGKKTPELAHVILTEFEIESKKSQIDFIKELPQHIFENEKIAFYLIELIFENIRNKNLQQAQWLASYSASQTNHPVFKIFQACLTFQEVEAVNSVMSINSRYKINQKTFKKLVKSLLKDEPSVLEASSPLKRDKAISFSYDRYIEELLLENSGSEHWLIMNRNKKLLSTQTGEMKNFKGKYITSNENYFVSLIKKVPTIFSWNSDELGEKLWGLDFSQLNVSTSFKEEMNNPSSSDLLDLDFEALGLGNPIVVNMMDSTALKNKTRLKYRLIGNYFLIQSENEIICMNAQNGNLIWRRYFRQLVSLERSFIDGNYLYLTNNSMQNSVLFNKIDIRNGFTSWKVNLSLRTSEPVHFMQRQREQSPNVAIFKNEIVLFGDTQWIYLDKKTGEFKNVLKEKINNANRQRAFATQKCFYVAGQSNYLMSLDLPIGSGRMGKFCWYKPNGKLLNKEILSGYLCLGKNSSVVLLDVAKQQIQIYDIESGKIIERYPFPFRKPFYYVKKLGSDLYFWFMSNQDRKYFRLNLTDMNYEELTFDEETPLQHFDGENYFAIRGKKGQKVFVYKTIATEIKDN